MILHQIKDVLKLNKNKQYLCKKGNYYFTSFLVGNSLFDDVQNKVVLGYFELDEVYELL